MRTLPLLVAAVLLFPNALPAQTLQQRIDHLRSAGRDADEVTERAKLRNTATRLNDVIESVVIEDASAREAFKWWASTTGVSLVLNWNAMENEGVDPEVPVTLRMARVPAFRVLELLMQSVGASAQVDMVYDVEPGYVHVMTKMQANRMPVTAVFDVSDLLMEVPNFTDAPQFDLREALSNEGGGSGSGGGGGSQSIFSDEDEDRQNEPTKTERGEQLAQLVRDSIEPLVWQENGGGATVKYLRGMLIVRAPKYVIRQIGVPVRSNGVPAIGGQVGRPSDPSPPAMPSTP